MAFRIHDVTIHLARPEEQDQIAPCTMLSGDEEGGCGQGSAGRPCQGKTEKPKPKPKPGGDKPGEDERDLASLQTRLRETLASPPL